MVAVRLMTHDDIEQATDVSARAFELDLDQPGARDRWRQRVAHISRTDPGGAFVAETGGEIVGVAEAMVREKLWVLALLTIDPAQQGAGIGRMLFDAALTYRGSAPGGGPGLIVSSDDPRAVRLYERAGFELTPTFTATGVVDPDVFGDPDPEIEVVGIEQLDRLEQVARLVRGAPMTLELPHALARGSTIFTLADRGYAVATPGDGIWSLTASDERSARRLLRRGLAHAAGLDPVRVRWITAAQEWAFEIVRDAGMSVTAHGGLCVRGRPGTLHPFLPSGAFA